MFFAILKLPDVVFRRFASGWGLSSGPLPGYPFSQELPMNLSLMCAKLFAERALHFALYQEDRLLYTTDSQGYLMQDPRYVHLLHCSPGSLRENPQTPPCSRAQKTAAPLLFWPGSRSNVAAYVDNAELYVYYLLLADAERGIRIVLGPFSLIRQDDHLYADYCAARRIPTDRFYRSCVLSMDELAHRLDLLYALTAGEEIHFEPSALQSALSALTDDASVGSAQNAASSDDPGMTFLSDAEARRKSYMIEKTYFDRIENGDLEAIRDPDFQELGRLGRIAPTSLKTYEYMCVTLIVLSSRAAIRGGLDAESAYQLSNRYLHTLSIATDIHQMHDLSIRCYNEYIRAVHDARKMAEKKQPPYLVKAVSYIRRNLYQELSARIVAQHCDISISQLSHTFTACLGLPPQKYITKMRLAAARDLLRYSDDPVSEIAERLRFPSHSRFSVLFREAYGQTPGAYRRRNGTGGGPPLRKSGTGVRHPFRFLHLNHGQPRFDRVDRFLRQTGKSEDAFQRHAVHDAFLDGHLSVSEIVAGRRLHPAHHRIKQLLSLGRGLDLPQCTVKGQMILVGPKGVMAEQRLGQGALSEIAKDLLKPGDAFRHPVIQAGRIGLTRILNRGIAQGEPVRAEGIHMAFKGNVVMKQRLGKPQSVVRGHRRIGAGRGQEAGAGVLVNGSDRIRRGLVPLLRGFFVQHRVDQDGGVRTVFGHRRRAGRQMAAGGKADHRDLVRNHVPLRGALADHGHGLLVIQQRPGPRFVLSAGIAQDERLVSGLQIGQRNRLRFAVRAEIISAARKNQHRRPRRDVGQLSADGLKVGGQRHVPFLV